MNAVDEIKKLINEKKTIQKDIGVHIMISALLMKLSNSSMGKDAKYARRSINSAIKPAHGTKKINHKKRRQRTISKCTLLYEPCLSKREMSRQKKKE
jgi:hypothetical protein